MKLYVELVDGSKSEIKVSGDVQQEINRITRAEPPKWVEGADGSWIQTSHIVRLVIREDGEPLVASA